MPTLSSLEKQALRLLAEREALYADEIQAALQAALKAIYGEMTAIYGKWAKNGKLTKAEMTAYNKYQTMEKNILKHLDPAIKANLKTIKRLLPEQYQAGFFMYAWIIDQATELRLDWGAVNTKAQMAAMDVANPKNIEIGNALKNYTIDSRKKIRSALLNGLTLGKSYPQMVKDLKLAADKIKSSAMTIVRTEGQRALNKAANDVYLRAIENGVEGVMVWDATLDSRTRPEHGAMDGVKKSADGYYHGAIGKAQYPVDPNLPPEQSINCRCRERFEIEGYSPQLTRTRAEGVIPYQNYQDYVNTYHPDWLDRKGYESLKKGV